jgi:hypothetical protein
LETFANQLKQIKALDHVLESSDIAGWWWCVHVWIIDVWLITLSRSCWPFSHWVAAHRVEASTSEPRVGTDCENFVTTHGELQRNCILF